MSAKEPWFQMPPREGEILTGHMYWPIATVPLCNGVDVAFVHRVSVS